MRRTHTEKERETKMTEINREKDQTFGEGGGGGGGLSSFVSSLSMKFWMEFFWGGKRRKKESEREREAKEREVHADSLACLQTDFQPTTRATIDNSKSKRHSKRK